MLELVFVALFGLLTTSSCMIGALIGLYVAIPRQVLAAILAFAAGSLISALALDLAYGGARALLAQSFGTKGAWGFISGGFALGALVYYSASRYIDRLGGAIRYPTRFREQVRSQYRKDAKATIRLLSNCGLLRHLPPDDIAEIIPHVRSRRLRSGEFVFHAGDEGNDLFIVAAGEIEIDSEDAGDLSLVARLSPGEAFGEMAILTGEARTKAARAVGAAEVISIGKEAFQQMVSVDLTLAHAVERLRYDRAVSNLTQGGKDAVQWAKIAAHSLGRLTPKEESRRLKEGGAGNGLAIVFGNVLDTIPGCLVIGAKFVALEQLSLTLAVGMFLGGIPEAAASAAILRRAGYTPKTILLLWSTVLVAGVVAALAGKVLIGSSDSRLSIFAEAVAGGAVLALVAHAMIPEAIEEGGSLVVLPTVGGFLFALYLVLAEAVPG